MMMFCDLHMHSTASDGTTLPEELPIIAKAAGVAAIALTDHDTTDGLPSCAEACARVGVQFVPGIEVSTDPGPPPGEPADLPVRRGTQHILGLFVRHDDPKLLQVRNRMQQARDSRNPAIVAKLNELGVNITYEEVERLAAVQGTQIIGRPHIAQVLIDKGYVKSVQDAFARYLRQGAPAYVRRDRLPPKDALDAIHHAGGLAILAHPVQLGLADPAALEHRILRLKELGLDGLETRHADHTAADAARFEALAAKHHLLTGGGSDFHGSRKPVDLGSQHVPMAVYERLHAAWQNRSSRSQFASLS